MYNDQLNEPRFPPGAGLTWPGRLQGCIRYPSAGNFNLHQNMLSTLFNILFNIIKSNKLNLKSNI